MAAQSCAITSISNVGTRPAPWPVITVPSANRAIPTTCFALRPHTGITSAARRASSLRPRVIAVTVNCLAGSLATEQPFDLLARDLADVTLGKPALRIIDERGR